MSLLSAIDTISNDIQTVKDDVSDIKGNVEFLVGKNRRDPSSNRPTTNKSYELHVKKFKRWLGTRKLDTEAVY